MAHIKINTFVLTNIGITGLWDRDYELSEVKLCMKAVSRHQLLAKEIPSDDKVILFDFQPVEYETMRPLQKYDLVFTKDVIEDLHSYLDSLEKPVALVAYNGFTFQFPILRSALGHLGYGMPDGIRCIDLMQSFFELQNKFGPQKPRDNGMLPWRYQPDNPFLSYAFRDLYERYTSKPYKLPNAPITKSDFESGIPVPHMNMWMECVYTVLEPFITWADQLSSSTVFNEGTLLREEL